MRIKVAAIPHHKENTAIGRPPARTSDRGLLLPWPHPENIIRLRVVRISTGLSESVAEIKGGLSASLTKGEEEELEVGECGHLTQPVLPAGQSPTAARPLVGAGHLPGLLTSSGPPDSGPQTVRTPLQHPAHQRLHRPPPVQPPPTSIDLAPNWLCCRRRGPAEQRMSLEPSSLEA